ncbi:uncharacterized protein LOC116194981 [Punica granatum]|uniref:Uncharacterized protein LOC116194981 n=2 Tax=Punica granatum TaxID=22663 RepID=A0A6P8C843_PUNGR|nr:uncharacterized protein LOC116194981 [Punica granatum]XP_031379783.1 uncharacterized protein LOC116194981 [Punica granatum]XP_031379784.1 uncharacterized protein LOC116194981 [Punica granatum]
MVQQTMDSKSTERGHGNMESDLASGDKQLPIAAKKTALRELRNENRIIVPSTTKSLSSFKDKDPTGDPNKVAGTKRPPPQTCSEFSVSPPRSVSPGGNAANGLVYVRRKSEAETAKSGIGDRTNTTPNNLQPGPLSTQEESLKQQSQIKEPKIVSYPAFASIPFTSPTGSSAKASVPLPLGMAGMKMGSSVEPKYGSTAPASSPTENSKMVKNWDWEERYKQLQKLLSDLEQADHKDYLQMLRSLSSVDLSWHAVELEKRSIQLSLEEAKEMQRVALLNVLGKSVKN